MIQRINKQFGLDIPLDYPIRTHQRKFRDCGGFNWMLCGKNWEYNRFGGCETITKMLKHKGNYSVYNPTDTDIELIAE